MRKLKTLFFIVLCIGMFSVTGCNKENNTVVEEKKEEVVESKFDISKYNKEVEKYTLDATNKKASIEVGFAKDLGYSRTDVKAIYRLVLENSYNKVEVQFFNTNLEKSQAVYKKEKDDFDPEKTKDYSKLNINGYEGWEIYHINSTSKKIMSYEAQLFLGENDGLTSVVKITINPSATKEEGKNFDIPSFVKSDDFQYLLYSIKLK